jgi:probable F420-dependent oxidoreductase
VRLGAVFPQGEFTNVDPDELVDFVQQLEAAGYDHLMVYDHVLGADSTVRPDWQGAYDHRDPFVEPLTLFAYLARSCGLEFVTDVLVLPQRQTALVAKQVATLALLAPGRIRLGVGIGWNDVEYNALGVDFSRRARRYERQIELLRRLWSEPVIDGSVDNEHIRAAGIQPLPTTRIPIWLGSGPAPAALARIGRLADGWIPMPQVRPGHGLEEAWQTVRAAADEAGRDPDTIGLEGQVWVTADRIAGTADRVARWRDAGAGAVAVNTLRSGAAWPTGHLDILLRSAEVLAAK